MRLTAKSHAQCEREKQIAEARLAKYLVNRHYGWSGKSWLLQGELPSAPELAHNVRKLELIPRPTQAKPAEEFLAEIGIAAKVAKGDKEGSHAPGQDNLSISRLPNGWHLCCVADGHGSYGHMISTHCARALPAHLANCASKQQEFDAQGALLEACAATQEDIDRVHEKTLQKYDAGNDLLSCSGSTCVCLLRDPSADSVWVACVGDSKAIMFNRTEVLHKTKVHKVSDASELKRIEEDCEVETKYHEDGSKQTRIYLKGKDYPGLMMTRSFGDYCVKNAGVIATPDVIEWTVPAGTDSKECYVMIASDGIWDFINPKEAQTILSDLLYVESFSLQDAAEQLVAEARAKWKKQKPTYCDDISVIIMPVGGEAFPTFQPKQICGCFPVDGCACSVQ